MGWNGRSLWGGRGGLVGGSDGCMGNWEENVSVVERVGVCGAKRVIEGGINRMGEIGNSYL